MQIVIQIVTHQQKYKNTRQPWMTISMEVDRVGQDEDDHDPAGPSFCDVALRKTTTATGPFSYGQIVKFDIQVLNQGNLPVRNVRVNDYIPTGFTGSALGANFPTWTLDRTVLPL
ncbi:MAG: hypothetical protein IPN86_07940 [Saprospiraceae bacterium]|nr:hypothetical protein [Saprospiraceae bacterium]